MRMFLFSVVMVFLGGLVVFVADKGMGVIPYKSIFPVLTGAGVAAHWMVVALINAKRSAKVMEETVHTGIACSLISYLQTEQIVEEMVRQYIADTAP